MQVGLMAPQGWKGEYDGWSAADAWDRTVALAEQAEGLGFESLWVFDHFHTVPEPTDEITFESFSVLVRTGDGDAAGPPRPHGRVHGVPQPGAHREAVVHDRRHLRWSLRARHRGRLEGRGVACLRLRLPVPRRPDGCLRGAPRDHHGDVRARPRLRGRSVRPRAWRHQHAQAPPGAAHPDHRRRQRAKPDGRLRGPLRRRAQLRLPARRKRSPSA